MKTKVLQSALSFFSLMCLATAPRAQQACDCTLPPVKLPAECRSFCADKQGTHKLARRQFRALRRMPQQQIFANGTSNYPLKPSYPWEMGLQVGTANIIGDVTSLIPGKSFGIFLRKPLDAVFSLRLHYNYNIAYGLNPFKEINGALSGPWLAYRGKRVFLNYRTELNNVGLDGTVSLANIRFHRSRSNINPYLIAGVGVSTYQARVNLLNNKGELYDYSSVPTYTSYKERRRGLRDQLDMLDDTYETAAENDGMRQAKLFGVTMLKAVRIGGGIAFRINNKVSLSVEDLICISNSDLMEGKQYGRDVVGIPVRSLSHDAVNYATLGLNINLGHHSRVPVWWSNPLEYMYSEIRNPRLMRLPQLPLPDADGDGVTDQLDQEQTPPGVPVDHNGISRDTDGDGVPDALDKELITPTLCQPVDKDGVGKCPCPEDCGGNK